jgi:hypothetical protein
MSGRTKKQAESSNVNVETARKNSSTGANSAAQTASKEDHSLAANKTMKKNTAGGELSGSRRKNIKPPQETPKYFSAGLNLYNLGKICLLPLAFYFTAFCILTYPLISLFSTHFFSDTGDGLQNVWNIWWVNKAITRLHQLPWRTTYLHYPYGISLLGHTLNPFNGFLAVFLMKFMTLVQAHNFIVILAFTAGGLTAFLLSYYITGSYRGSIIAGYIFTFSSYHFSHAQGHLQLVSLEWIPLFVLLWYILVTKPSILVAAGSGLALFAVVLCDYYYFFYCVLTGILILSWFVVKKKSVFFFLRKEYLFSFAVFFAISFITTIPLIAKVIVSNIKNPFSGAHQTSSFSLDLLAPFIPGGHWRFADLTQFYWSKLPGNIHESSVYAGLSVIFLLVFVWLKRKSIRIQSLYLWYFMLVFFAIMSLGPELQVFGKKISSSILPYALLEEVFPLLKISGVPVRMMVMVMLCASVISAAGLETLFQQKRFLPAVLLVILFFEYLPKPLPASRIQVPEYISVLKSLPDDGGVVDTMTNPCLALYYQTVHEKPVAFGYVSRTPENTVKKDNELIQVILKRQYSRLYRDYNIRYFISGKDMTGRGIPVKIICDDKGIKLHGLTEEK